MAEVLSDTEFDEQLAKLLANPRVEELEDGRRKVTLETPVEYNGQDVRAVTFRRAKGKDWRMTDSEKGDLAKAFKLASSLSRLPMSVFDDMEEEDMLLCVGVAGTMGKKSQIGETS